MSAEPPDPYLGRVIADRFRVEAQLGVGSFGTVYRATQVQLSRPVALKVLRASLATDPSNVERFTREARLASQLDHPNVVRVFDYGTDAAGITYLAMELLEGVELSTVIARESPLAPGRIAALLGQVLSALATAHRLGIVHRDLKPENIMLVERPGEDGQPREVVKVTDFGIARVYGEAAASMDAITRFGTVNGTPEFMSPEQALAEELDGRADLYACGVMLYEMLAGRLPFTGETALEVLEQQLRTEPVPPSRHRAGVDPGLEAVALRALAKKRDDRFADAAEMRAALLAAAETAAPAPAPAPSVLVEISEPAPAPAATPPSDSSSAPSVLVEISEGGGEGEGGSARAPAADAAPAPSVLVESGPSVLVEPASAPPAEEAPPRSTTERIERPRGAGAGVRVALGLVALVAVGGGALWWWRAQVAADERAARERNAPWPTLEEPAVTGGADAGEHSAPRRRVRVAPTRSRGVTGAAGR